VGNDLGSLSEELGKIALYVGAAPSKPLELTTKILSEAVGDYNEFGIFRLTDAVGARDLPGALRIARGLFEQGLPQAGGGAAATDETRVAAALADRIHAKVSEIFRARAVLDSGGSPDDVGKALGKNRFFVPVLVAEARRYPPAREGGALEALFEAESRVKSGGSGRHEIEVLLARVIGTGGKQAAT
jgi:DNA polymerase III delta subunit